MGIGDAFLGAHLLANAIADGLAGDEAHLLRSLAAYQSAFRQKTMPVFEYTVKAAALKNPAPSLALYSKLAQSQEETTRFMDVLAGTFAFKQYFAPSNLSFAQFRHADRDGAPDLSDPAMHASAGELTHAAAAGTRNGRMKSPGQYLASGAGPQLNR